MKYEFTGILQEMIDKAVHGRPGDVDYIMDKLVVDATLAMPLYEDKVLFIQRYIDTEKLCQLISKPNWRLETRKAGL